MHNKSIQPGRPWLDTEGKPIQAHGGAIFYENQSFYWYGENKEKTDGKSGIWTWGLRAYSSKDLYNWKDLGVFLPPEPDNKNQPMYPENRADRPHIVFNNKTGKYVC